MQVAEKVLEHPLFTYESLCESINHLLRVFVAHETRLWSNLEVWGWVTRSMQRIIDEYVETEFNEEQSKLCENYHALEEYLTGLTDVADISANFLSVSETGTNGSGLLDRLCKRFS